MIPPRTENDRVRHHTTPNALREINDQTRANLRRFGAQSLAELDARIPALEQRLVARVGRRRAGVLTQHALTGWSPPVPVFRKLGVRTQNQLDQEHYALKASRGDFAHIATPPTLSSKPASSDLSVPWHLSPTV